MTDDRCQHPNAKPASGYAMGCRCPRCRDGARAYQREYARRNRDHRRVQAREAYRARRRRGLPR